MRIDSIEEFLGEPTDLVQSIPGLSEEGIIRPPDYGKRSEAAKGLTRGMREQTQGFTATAAELGSKRAERAYRRMELEEPYRRNLQPAPGAMNTLVGEAAAGVPEAAKSVTTLVGGGLLAGATGGGSVVASAPFIASIFGRSWGMNVKQGRDMGLDDDSARIYGTVSSALEAVVELSLGPERYMAGFSKQYYQKAAARLALTAGDDVSKRMSRMGLLAILRPTTFAGRAIGAIGEEIGEELVQAPAQEAIDWMIGGKWDLTMSDMAEVVKTTAMRTIPSGLLAGIMGGGVNDILRKEQEYRVRNEPTPQARGSAYMKGGTPTDTVKMDSTMAAMSEILGQRFAPDDVQGALKIIRNVSENLASMDENRLPEEFAETLTIAFERGEVDMAAWHDASEIKDPDARLAAQVDTLKRTPGFGQEYYKVMDRAEAIRMRQENDERERAVFKRGEDETAQALENVVAAPEDGSEVFAVHAYAAMDKATYGDVYKRGVVRQVKIDGNTYSVHARGTVRTPAGGRFVVKPGDLVFVQNDEAIGAQPDLGVDSESTEAKKWESMRRSYLDAAEGLDSDWAYDQRYDQAAMEMTAQEDATAIRAKLELERQQGAEQVRKFEERAAKAEDAGREQVKAKYPENKGAIKDFDQLANAIRFPRQEPAVPETPEQPQARVAENLAALAQRTGIPETMIAQLDRDTQENMLADPEYAQELSAAFLPRLQMQQEMEARKAEPAVQKQQAAQQRINRVRDEVLMRKAMRDAGIEQTRLSADEAGTVRGQYDPGVQTMRFYQNATADDIVHEWFHHITETTGLLPSPMRDALLRAYAPDGRWTGNSAERAVQDFLGYAQSKQVPDGVSADMLRAFEHMRKVMAHTAGETAPMLSDDSLAMFDAWFGMEAENASFLSDARALADRTSQAVAFDKRRDESLFSQAGERAATANVGQATRAEANKALHAAFGSHEAAHDAAVEKFGVKSLTDVPDADLLAWAEQMQAEKPYESAARITEMARAMGYKNYGAMPEHMQEIARRQLNLLDKAMREPEIPVEVRANQTAVDERIKADAQEGLSELAQRPSPFSMDRARPWGGPKALEGVYGVLKAMGKGITKAGKAAGEWMLQTYDTPTILSVLSDGNNNSFFAKKMGGMLYHMGIRYQNHAVASVRKQTEFFNKHGIGKLPDFLGGQVIVADTSMNEERALALALIGRGDVSKNQDGTYSSGQTEALWQSNGHILAGNDQALFESMVKDAWSKVEGHEYLGKMRAAIDEFLAWEHEQINAARSERGMGPIGRVQNYFPILRKGGMFWAQDPQHDELLNAGKREGKIDPQARQQHRHSPMGQEINLDAMSVLNAYRKQADIFVTKEADILHMQRVLDRMADGFRRAGMNAERRALHDQLQSMRYHNGRSTPFSPGELAIRTYNAHYKMFALIGNVSSALRQTFSLPTAGVDLPFGASFKLVHHQARLMAYAVKNMGKLSEGKNMLDGDFYWDMMVKGGSKHPHAKHDPAVIDIEEAVRVMSKWRFMGLPAKDAAMLPQRFFDQITRTASWASAYETRRAELAHETMTEAQKHDIAFRFAEQNKSQTQPAADFDERALIQKGNEYVRTMIPFTGMLFKNWNIAVRHCYLPSKIAFGNGMAKGGHWGAMQEVWHVFAGTEYAKERYGVRTGVGHKVMFAYVIPGMAMGMLARGRPHKDIEEFWKDLFAYNVAMVPIFGPVISGKMLYEGFMTDGAPTYYELINGIGDMFKHIKDGDLNKLTETGLREAAKATGFPNKLLKITKDAASGEYLDRYGKDIDWIKFIDRGVMGFKDEDEGGLRMIRDRLK